MTPMDPLKTVPSPERIKGTNETGTGSHSIVSGLSMPIEHDVVHSKWIRELVFSADFHSCASANLQECRAIHRLASRNRRRGERISASNRPSIDERSDRSARRD